MARPGRCAGVWGCAGNPDRFQAFISFNPAAGLFKGAPVDHPFPLRQRSIVTMLCLQRPCYQAMARDLYDYVRENPTGSEAGLKDMAALLRSRRREARAADRFCRLTGDRVWVQVYGSLTDHY